ncbi:MAG: hypothetical protein HYV02_08805 [Deltaproteobacteria bacterium]|nr:hypothetical protein [Deltaproteobacteria bacterium]
MEIFTNGLQGLTTLFIIVGLVGVGVGCALVAVSHHVRKDLAVAMSIAGVVVIILGLLCILMTLKIIPYGYLP